MKKLLTTKELRECFSLWHLSCDDYPNCCAIEIITEFPNDNEVEASYNGSRDYKNYLLQVFFENLNDCIRGEFELATKETIKTIESIFAEKFVKELDKPVFKVALLVKEQSYAVRIMKKLKPVKTFYFKSTDGERDLVEFTFKR